jgi:serine/threonine protein kinase
MKELVKFDEYYLVERIAIGGMAEVFKGISYGEEGFERVSAVKRVLPHIAEDREFIEMFIDEAKIAAQLQHPNIGQVYHLGQSDGKYFIAMEFISGQDLRIIFDRARSNQLQLDIGLCVYLVSEICEALDYAHRKTNARQEPMHLVHRDISPQNLVLGYDGSVKLIDFGIAKAEGKINQTQSGILKGKFSYMSPEQAHGHKIDARSDLFALAIVLYELLTLERCFLGQSDFSTIERIRQVEFIPPRKIRRDIPIALERILQKGLNKDVHQRYQSAADFQEALKRFVKNHQINMGKEYAQRFICQLFRSETQREQNRLQEFRQYAQQNIPLAQRAGGYQQQGKFKQNEILTGSYPKVKPRFALADKPKVSLSHQNQEYRRSYNPSIQPKSSMSPVSKLIILALIGLLAGGITAVMAWKELPQVGSIRVLTQYSEALDYVLYGERFKRQGKTPLWIQKLPVGDYRIQLTSPFYEMYTENFKIKPQQLNTLSIKLKSKDKITPLKITSQPEKVMISLNGITVGRTPLILPQEQGLYQIKAEKKGYQNEQRQIQLTKKVNIINFTLYPDYLQLHVTPSIDHAKIFLRPHNKSWRLLGTGPQNIQIKNQDHYALKVEVDGYKTQILYGLKSRVSHKDLWVDLIAKTSNSNLPKINEILNLKTTINNQNTMIESLGNSNNKQNSRTTSRTTSRKSYKYTKASTSRKDRSKIRKKKKRKETYKAVKKPVIPKVQTQPGLLKLVANPPAEVFIQGKSIGWTPLLNYKLSEGVHRITLKLENGESYQIKQSILAGRVSLRRWKKP